MNGWAILAAVLSGCAAACLPPVTGASRACIDTAAGRVEKTARGRAKAGVEFAQVDGAGVTGRPGATPGTVATTQSKGAQRGPWAHGFFAVAAAVGAALLIGGRLGLVAAVLTGVFAWRVLRGMEPRSFRVRREQLERALPATVDLLASAISAGASTTHALDRVADAVDPPIRDELRVIGRRLAFGVDPVRVWADVGKHPQLGPLGRCIGRALDSGAPVSGAMRRLAEDLRRSTRAAVEGRARSVGVKAAAPLGLCLLPAFLLVGVVPLVAGSVGVLAGR